MVIVRVKGKKIISTIDLQNISENFGAEILISWNSMKHRLKERHPLSFIPLKFRDLLTDERRQRLLFNQIVTIYVLFRCCVLLFNDK